LEKRGGGTPFALQWTGRKGDEGTKRHKPKGLAPSLLGPAKKLGRQRIALEEGDNKNQTKIEMNGSHLKKTQKLGRERALKKEEE